MKFNDLKISKKIGLSIISSVVLLAALTVITIGAINQINASATLTRDESSKFAILAKEVEIHVIQTQQWLTDISATRGFEGFDDGLMRPKNRLKKFIKNLVNSGKCLLRKTRRRWLISSTL